MVGKPDGTIDLIGQLLLAEMVTPPRNGPLRMALVIVWPARPPVPAQAVYMGETPAVSGRMYLTLAISVRARPTARLDIFRFSARLPPSVAVAASRLACLANSAASGPSVARRPVSAIWCGTITQSSPHKRTVLKANEQNGYGPKYDNQPSKTAIFAQSQRPRNMSTGCNTRRPITRGARTLSRS